MSKTIKIAESLSLPLDAITNTFAVFGIRGAGKSNIGAVMAEGIIKAGQPVCIIDPTGSWYGLKVQRMDADLVCPSMCSAGNTPTFPRTHSR